jgi:putative copper export protein
VTSISSRSRYSVLLRTIGRPSARRKPVMVFVAATAVTGAAALALGLWLAGDFTFFFVDMMTIGGSSNLTGWGLPAFKLAMDLSAIGVIGLLVTCLLLPAPDRELGAMARSCLRTATWLSLVCSASTAALLIFTWSDVSAQPVTAFPFGKLFTDTAQAFPDAAVFMTSILLALVIAAGAAVTRTRRGALILLLLGVYSLVTMGKEGNASHSGTITWSMVVHVSALSLWVGGLAVLVTHVRRDPELLAVVVPRFSTLAGVCYFAVAASGIVGASEMLDYTLSNLWGTRYGVLVMIKVGALIALGICGWWHRRRTVPRIRAGQSSQAHRAFIRLATAEVLIMVVAAALGVALSRTSSPDMIGDDTGRDSGMSSVHVHVQPGIRAWIPAGAALLVRQVGGQDADPPGGPGR